MKGQLLLVLALAAMPVQAKMEHYGLAFKDWEILSRELLVLPDSWFYAVKITQRHLGFDLVCRGDSDELIFKGVIDEEILHDVEEKKLLVFCTQGHLRIFPGR